MLPCSNAFPPLNYDKKLKTTLPNSRAFNTSHAPSHLSQDVYQPAVHFGGKEQLEKPSAGTGIKLPSLADLWGTPSQDNSFIDANSGNTLLPNVTGSLPRIDTIPPSFDTTYTHNQAPNPHPSSFQPWLLNGPGRPGSTSDGPMPFVLPPPKRTREQAFLEEDESSKSRPVKDFLGSITQRDSHIEPAPLLPSIRQEPSHETDHGRLAPITDYLSAIAQKTTDYLNSTTQPDSQSRQVSAHPNVVQEPSHEEEAPITDYLGAITNAKNDTQKPLETEQEPTSDTAKIQESESHPQPESAKPLPQPDFMAHITDPRDRAAIARAQSLPNLSKVDIPLLFWLSQQMKACVKFDQIKLNEGRLRTEEEEKELDQIKHYLRGFRSRAADHLLGLNYETQKELDPETQAKFESLFKAFKEELKEIYKIHEPGTCDLLEKYAEAKVEENREKSDPLKSELWRRADAYAAGVSQDPTSTVYKKARKQFLDQASGYITKAIDRVKRNRQTTQPQ